MDRLYDVGVAGLHRLVAHMDSIMNARVTYTKTVTLHMGLSIKDLAQLEFISTKIRRLKDVYSVQRFTGGSSQ